MQQLGQYGRPAWVGALGLAAILGGISLIAIFMLSPATERIITLFLIYMIGVLGFQIYSGNSGILSFGHVSFMAIGAYASALLTMAPAVQSTALPNLPAWIAALNGQSLPVAVLGSGLVVLIAALVFGLPIARLGGSAAAIATLGILVITHVVLVATPDLTRGSQTFFGIPRGVPTWLAMVCAITAALIARFYRSSRSGLALRATREDEIAAAAMGVRADRLRFQSFVLGAILCGVSGALLAHFLGAFSPKDFYFNLTFLLLSMLILGGISTVSGAVIGTAAIVTLMQILRRFEQGADLGFLSLPQVFGLTDIGIGATILLVMYRMHDGLTGVRELSERLTRIRVSPSAARVTAAPSADPAATLQIKDVSRQFGGLVALDNVSLEIKTGMIVGLIGPNGAGKSTLINAICSIVPASSGQILIGDRDMAGMAVHEVPAAGLGRTFQNIRLFGNLTVTENVQVAANSVTGSVADSAAAVRAALHMVGLTALSERLASTLPYGAQRRLEIARALALQPRFLLLDEPAAGMNPIETEELLRVLQRIRDEYRLGILIVEHDLKLIMNLCDQIVVLDKGLQIASGTPEEVRADPKVIKAYIGSSQTTDDHHKTPGATATRTMNIREVI